MEVRQLIPWKWRAAAVASILTLTSQLIAPVIAGAQDASTRTKTPIQHVIVIIGENRTFDHIFATYKPVPGESISNLLSKRVRLNLPYPSWLSLRTEDADLCTLAREGSGRLYLVRPVILSCIFWGLRTP
ncbi:MAG TPA: hypothetical protein VEV41_28205 [Terriglobales bacterium]|nr:hypothetical protein [Terriglobales bacterium]